jgi:PII-like signaling protein
MLYIEISENDIFSGQLSLGIHTEEGQDYDGKEFYQVVIGLLFFEIIVGKTYGYNNAN